MNVEPSGPRSKMDRDLRRFESWAADHQKRGDAPIVPAATVVLLRDGPHGVETLMLRRNSKVVFGGMWVFPGGRIDDGDRLAGDDDLRTARRAAAREAAEEAGTTVDPETMAHFSYWIPPPIAPKRFATWFFAAPATDEVVTIDDGEIKEHAWMRPDEAIARRDALEIELAPPTWVTLHMLQAFESTSHALEELHARPARFYMTHIVMTDDGPLAMWDGDAGYESGDPSLPGRRHRLLMSDQGYRFWLDA